MRFTTDGPHRLKAGNLVVISGRRLVVAAVHAADSFTAYLDAEEAES